MSIQSALDHIETKLRDLAVMPDHELRWLLSEIGEHLPRHLTPEVLMAAIDDVATGVTTLNGNINKLLDALAAEGGGQSAAVAELADVNTKLGVVAKVLDAINASVEGALNPTNVGTVDPTAPMPAEVGAVPVADPNAAPAPSVLG